MIETHLILLGVNIFQRNREDSRREKEQKMKDRMVEDRREYLKSSICLYLLAHILVLG